MKNILTSVILIIASGVLLSSCSNLSKISFTKRHYRSGYYVDFGNKKSNILATSRSVATIPAKTKCHIPSPIVIAKESHHKTLNTLKITTGKITTSQKIANRKEVKYFKPINNSSASFVTSPSTPTYRNGESEGDVHARVDINVPYVVIILCAIFIPPLGVGLMYGLNSYFWIDLILTLLFFIPGMIFALIVVLM